MELEQDLTRPADGSSPRPATPDHPDVHMTILQTLLDLQPNAPGKRLGRWGQQPRRELEEVVRLRAAQCAAHLRQRGCRQRDTAQRLALKARTLRSWMPTCPGSSALPPLGRPLTPANATLQQAVVSWLDAIGPGVGVPALRTRFAEMARAELDELVKEYRRCWRAANPRLIHVLHWQRPGAVWAMDFAEAPCLIDGRYPYLLAVRDLASGLQLLWQPVADLTVESVLAELPW